MPDRTFTVNLDHSVSIDNDFLAVQGEQISVDVIVPASLAALGYDAYIDFLLPDGTAYFKGAYDSSSGTVSFTLGAVDSMLDKDGELFWQLVLATTVGTVRTEIWKSIQGKTIVLSSINATTSAILPYVPQMVFPNTYPASNVSIDDVGGWLGDTNVEDALQNVGHAVSNLNTEVGSLNYTEENYIVADESLTDSVDKLDMKIYDHIQGGSSFPFTTMPYVGIAPIIESGSNGNGHYIKYADGTMICRHSQAVSGLANTSANGALYSGSGSHTFAAEFIAAPDVNVMYIGEHYIFVNGYNFTTTQVIYLTSSPISETVTGGYMSIIAIGRWKA